VNAKSAFADWQQPAQAGFANLLQRFQSPEDEKPGFSKKPGF